MRQLGTVGGVLIAVATLTLAACGSSGTDTSSSPTSTVPSESTTSSSVVTTTTQPLDPATADTKAQYTLSAAVAAAHSIFEDTDDFTAVSPASLTPLVAHVQFTDLDQASKTTVGVLAQTMNDVLLVTRSASGRWFCVTENDTDGVSYGYGKTLADVNSNGECQLDAWPPPGTK